MSDDTSFTLSDLLRVLGVVLILASFLGLATVPGLIVEWLHRDGYRRTEAIVTTPDTSRLKMITLKLAQPGVEVYFRRSAFDGVKQGAAQDVWYNAEARVEWGIVWYDSRLISATRYPQLLGGGVALGYLIATLAAAGLGLYFVLRPANRP
jgi:hypothetical protein